jgi:hypothetical protein
MSKPTKLSDAELAAIREMAKQYRARRRAGEWLTHDCDRELLLRHVDAQAAELAVQAEEIRRLTDELRISQDTAKDEAMFANESNAQVDELDAEVERLTCIVTGQGGLIQEKDAEIRRLREALEPFARIVPYLGVLPDRESISDLHDFTAGQCRRAAKAMEKG